MAEFPQSARVVIIGQGGIVGASVAHHLIERGWDDIVGIDKSSMPDRCRLDRPCLRLLLCNRSRSHDVLDTTMYSIDFYERIGHVTVKVGGLEVARVGDDERMGRAQTQGRLGHAPSAPTGNG